MGVTRVGVLDSAVPVAFVVSTDPDGNILPSHHGKEEDFKEFLASAPDLSALEIDRSGDGPR
jgi:hypothetical protein